VLIGTGERYFLGAGLFLGDQLVEVGEFGGFVQCDEVRWILCSSDCQSRIIGSIVWFIQTVRQIIQILGNDAVLSQDATLIVV